MWQPSSIVVCAILILQYSRSLTVTGTTLLIGDSVDVEFLYSNIRGARDATNTVGAGFFTLPCTNVPTVGMILNNTILNISPEIFNLGVLEGNTCVGGIVADDVGMSIAVHPPF